MAFIIFPEKPSSLGVGRSYRDGSTDPDTGAFACEVDEVLGGETEISADEHARIKAAAEAHYEASPPVPTEEVVAAPSPEERIAQLEAQIAVLAEKAGVTTEQLSAPLMEKA